MNLFILVPDEWLILVEDVNVETEISLKMFKKSHLIEIYESLL